MNLYSLIVGAVALGNAQTIEVHGHRGARARFPENTIPAFDYALKMGVDVLELDMNVTKDNVLVVTHDSSISPKICLQGDGEKLKKPMPVRSLTLEEIKSFDCGSLKNSKFENQTPVPHTQVPTLQEVFDLVKNSELTKAKSVRFNIETKIEESEPELSPNPETFAQLVLDAIKKNNLADRVIVQSFDYRTLREIRKLDSSIQLSALIENKMPNLKDLKADFHPEVISPDYDLLDREDVELAHQLQMKVIPWTANTKNAWKKLVSLHVDGIISDDPEALIEFLKGQ